MILFFYFATTNFLPYYEKDINKEIKNNIFPTGFDCKIIFKWQHIYILNLFILKELDVKIKFIKQK